jgi:hypothetical protein
MTRKSIALLAGSHLLVVLAGVLLARQAGANADQASIPAESAGTTPGKSGMPGLGSASTSGGFRPSKEWHGSEFARAWKAVRAGKFTTPERLKAQRELLKRWAEVDLTAAIEAAMGEAWDDDHGEVFGGGTGPLLDVFWEAFAKNPQEGWDMIRGRQFGVATGILRGIWMSAVGAKDPLFLATHVGELSWRDRQDALYACQNGISRTPGGVTGADVFKVLAGLPEDVVTTEQLLEFASPHTVITDPASLKEEILRLGSGDGRLAKVKAMLLGRALAAKSPGEIAGEIQDLPKELGQEVLWAAFKGGRNAEGVLGVMDLLIREDAWAKVEQRDTVQQLQRLSRNGGAAAVADWATTLPVRKETSELFYRSVETYLRENMDTSRTWIAGIPTPGWRDRAYAEYSQQALNAHNDAAASRWALDQIGDSAFKGEAESWRSQWEKRTGWKQQ